MQAARGTPVGTTTPTATGRSRVVFAVVALLAYAADQVSKAVAVAELDGRPDVPLVGDVLQLSLVRNPGAAFGLGTDLTPFLTALAAVAAVTVVWFARRLGSALWGLALGLLLAGVVGNLTDRLVRPPGFFEGHVIDFLRLPNWPVFNLADICINVAAGLIVLQAIRGIRVDGTHERDHAPDDPQHPQHHDADADPDLSAARDDQQADVPDRPEGER
jgi:signal peptidase II